MTVFPTLTVRSYEASLKFYTEKLGFTSDFTMAVPLPDGGTSTFGILRLDQGTALMIGQDSGDYSRGQGVELMLYPEEFDVDAHYEQVQQRGVEILRPIKTEYWGDRVYAVKDPDGYVLVFGKTVEQVPPEEVMERLKQRAG